MRIIPRWAYVVTGVLVLALLGVPLFYYGHQFSGGRSNTAGDWEAFGSFWGAFVAMANLVIFTFLSLLVYRYTARRDEENTRFQEGLARPLLVFGIEETMSVWKVENVGNGPALRVVVGEANEMEWVGANVKLYTLGKEQSIPMNWLNAGGILCAVYEDIYKRRYISVGVRHETTITEEVNQVLSEQEAPFIFSMVTVEAWMKRETVTIQEARRRKSGLSSTTTIQTTSKAPGD